MIGNQLIRRVDVYRGYQINISFNFDLTPYIEGSDSAACKSLKTVQAKQCSPRFLLEKKKSTVLPAKYSAFLVENTGSNR